MTPAARRPDRLMADIWRKLSRLNVAAAEGAGGTRWTLAGWPQTRKIGPKESESEHVELSRSAICRLSNVSVATL